MENCQLLYKKIHDLAPGHMSAATMECLAINDPGDFLAKNQLALPYRIHISDCNNKWMIHEDRNTILQYIENIDSSLTKFIEMLNSEEIRNRDFLNNSLFVTLIIKRNIQNIKHSTKRRTSVKCVELFIHDQGIDVKFIRYFTRNGVKESNEILTNLHTHGVVSTTLDKTSFDHMVFKLNNIIKGLKEYKAFILSCTK